MRTPDGAAPTADAVSRLLPRLTPTAVLLTDHPDDATRLLGAALAGPGVLADAPAALRALARTAAAGPSRWSAEQVIESLSPPDPDDDAPLADALRTLSPSDRAAAVLALVGGGTADEAAGAAVARLTVAVAGRDEEARRAHDAATALFRAPGSSPAPPAPAVALPERLARLAAGRRLPPTAPAAITAAVDAARLTHRRRRRRLVGGVLAVGLLAVLVPLVPEATRTPSATATSVYAGDTRGSLAEDEDFLRAMRDVPWPPARTADTRRVVFAGEVAGARFALVASGGTASRPAAIGWFAGPQGAAPEQMRLIAGRGAPDPAEPVALTDPATGALVVVALPEDRIAISARPEYTSDGRVRRTFDPVGTSRGVAVLGLTPLPGTQGSAVRLDVVRDGVRLPASRPAVVADPDVEDVALPTIRLRAAAPPVAGDASMEVRLRSLLGQLGQAPAEAAVTVLWSGDLPGPNDRSARFAVVAVEQPSGAVVVTAPYGYAADSSGRAGTSWCGTGVLPAGEPLEQRLVAVRCDISDGTADREISRFLVVVGPRTATSVELLDVSGAVLGEHPLSDGVAVVRSPGDVEQLRVRTADGGTATTTPLVESDVSG